MGARHETIVAAGLPKPSMSASWKNVRIALHPAGAIPFYSDLDTVDMLGLNDPEIPQHGILAADVNRRPGHRRWTTLRYLVDSKVNLVLGAPIVVPPGVIPDRWRFMLAGEVAGALSEMHEIGKAGRDPTDMAKAHGPPFSITRRSTGPTHLR